MRAFAIDHPGSFENLSLRDLEKPLPNNDEILVRLHAAGLNPVDYKVLVSGHKKWVYPFVPGLDGAGVVEAVGSAVTDFQPGDRVFYHGDLSKPGVFAEYAVTTAITAAKIPEGMDFITAAALPCAGLTAYQALTRKVNTKSMTWALIHGGAGGVGGFALQIAKHLGLRTITTCSRENEAFVRNLGADEVIDYRTEDVTKRVLALTDQLGADLILNTVSKESSQEDLIRLGYNGHLISIVDLPDLLDFNPYRKAISIHSLALGGAHSSKNDPQKKDLRRMLEELAALAAEGTVDPMISKVLPFEELKEGLRDLTTRHVRGKIVVRMRE